MSLIISSPPNTRREQSGKPTRLERQGKVARSTEEGVGREVLAFWPDCHSYLVLGERLTASDGCNKTQTRWLRTTQTYCLSSAGKESEVCLGGLQ